MSKTRWILALFVLGVIPIRPADAATLNLKASTNKYVRAVNGGGGAVSATADSAGTTETFTLIDGQCLYTRDQISLRTSGGKYVGISSAGDLVATATSYSGSNEKFAIYSNTIDSGIVNSGTSVRLLASNNNWVCADSAGNLKANCGAPVNAASFTLTLAGVNTTPLSVTFNPSSPIRAGYALNLTASPQNGPAGTNKYRWTVTNNAGGAMVKDSGVTTTYSWAAGSDLPAGSYTLTATVYRYCGEVKVAERTSTVNDFRVASVDFNAPSNGQTITPGSSVTIRWNPTNVSGNATLAYYEGSTFKTNIAPATSPVAFSSGSYIWAVPGNLSQTSHGKILIMSTTNSALQWSSPFFTVGAGSGSTTPTVSFANHLYPLITNSQKCGMCHGGTSYYPQRATGRVDDSSTPNCNESLTIPFNTSISATEMLNRLKCLRAMSTDSTYSQANGRIYVVPYQSSNSGLHYKAQASNAPTFSENLTIGGVTKMVKEWITIWINQGANP